MSMPSIFDGTSFDIIDGKKECKRPWGLCPQTPGIYRILTATAVRSLLQLVVMRHGRYLVGSRQSALGLRPVELYPSIRRKSESLSMSGGRVERFPFPFPGGPIGRKRETDKYRCHLLVAF